MQLRRMADAGFAGIARSLFQFSLPLILSGVLQQLYSWADAFIVGRVEGELALAAVGATGTVVNLFLTIITGFTLGLSILCAQKYGSGERSAIPQILATFSLLFAVLFLFLAAAGALLSPWALRLLHTPSDALPLAEAYLRIVFAGIPFLAVYNVFSAALRGLGDSRTPFMAVLISSLVNIALDVVLVACLHWGVGGAALATVLSQAAMTLFLVIYSRRKHPLLRFHPGLRMLNRRALSQGLRMGFPPHDPVQCQRFRWPHSAELHERFRYPNGSGDYYGLSRGFHHSAAHHQPGIRHLHFSGPKLRRQRRAPSP